MSQLLIAGLGYVGSEIARQHQASGGHAIGLARSKKPDAPCPVHPCDLADAEQVRAIAAAIGAPPAAIIHCAASGRGGGAEAYRAVYLEGARNLVSTFPGVPLLFTSSTGVYPQSDDSEVTEESPAEPERDTARILREAEQVVLDARGIVLRLSGLYGPGRSIHLQRLLAGEAVLEGPVGDDGEDLSRFLNQIHRDDAASAALHLIDRPHARGQIYNGSDSTPLRQHGCTLEIAELLGLPVPPETDPDATPSAFGSGARGLSSKRVLNRKLRNTGWHPRYPSFLDAVAGDPDLVPSIRRRLET